MHPDQHVVDRCEIAVEAQGLKGASDPETGDRVRWATGKLGRGAAVGQPNAARLRGDIARDQVDERRLAGAVRSDQPEDGAVLDLEGHSVDGAHATEVTPDVRELKQGAHGSSSRWSATWAGSGRGHRVRRCPAAGR